MEEKIAVCSSNNMVLWRKVWSNARAGNFLVER